MAYIWQISIVAFSKKTVVRGVVLDGRPKMQNKRSSRVTNLFTLIRSYTTSPLKNSLLTLKLNQNEYKTATDNKGFFGLELDFSLVDKPDVSIFFQDKELQINQGYPIFFKHSESNIVVISDIDDTILVSYTANLIKRIGVLSLVSPQRRKTVEFTQKLLDLLGLYNTNVFYVSKSESNLFGILSSFINHNQLPAGILFLTPYLNFRQLLNSKKGKDFKLNNIKFIIENSGDKRFILFGDDTQGDMMVYKVIAETYPDKIMRIYIRQTKRSVNRDKLSHWKKLKETFSDSVYFNKDSDVNLELKELENLMSIKTI